MGSYFSKTDAKYLPEDIPASHIPSKYDPHFGFNDGNSRTKREIKMTEEELDSAWVIEFQRDFCVHKRVEYHACIKHNIPFIMKCRGLKQELEDCYLEDNIIAMKEYEREKRLNARERRIREQKG